MKRLVLAAAVALLAGFPAASNAALIQLDALAAGDGLITKDTGTGMEWLDLTFTVDRSYLEIDAALGTDPFLVTFRRASAAEVHDLFEEAGFLTLGVLDEANVPAARLLTGLLGDTMAILVGSGRHGAMGLLSDTTDHALRVRTATFLTDVFALNRCSGYADSPDGEASDSHRFSFIGHYLVRSGHPGGEAEGTPIADPGVDPCERPDDVPGVPEPSATMLLAGGFALFAQARARRR